MEGHGIGDGLAFGAPLTRQIGDGLVFGTPPAHQIGDGLAFVALQAHQIGDGLGSRMGQPPSPHRFYSTTSPNVVTKSRGSIIRAGLRLADSGGTLAGDPKTT